MEGNSKAGKKVERLIISDDPHERYQERHPQTGEKIKPGIPILIKAKGGKVIRKDITYYSILCPECSAYAEYTHDSEPICPECGIICSGSSAILQDQMVRDAKAAGRIDDSSTGDSTA